MLKHSSLLVSIVLTLMVAVGCSDSTAPAPVGEVRGMVMVDGSGLPGVDVELSGVEQRTITTDAAGRFSFSEVRVGAYVVTIRGAPADASFAATSKPAVIAREPGRQTETLDFVGNYIRTSSITGRVTSRERPLSNIGVRIEGPDTVLTSSGQDGRFSVAGIRSGSYTVAISGFPSSVSFPAVEREVDVGIGGSATVNFDGDPELTATVVISSLVRRLPSGETATADPGNLHGRVEVQLTVDRGEETPESVELLLGGEVVGSQLFNLPVATGSDPPDDGVALPASSSFQLTFSVDTHEFDPETGVARFMNGDRLLEARLSTREGGEGVWTSAIPVTLNNRTTFTGSMTPSRGPVAGADGKEWVGGDIQILVRPVLYSIGREVTSVTMELRRTGGAMLRERTTGGEAPFLVVFPGSGSPSPTNVAAYQTPRGETDQIRVTSARYGDGTFVNSPPALLVPEVRIDNVPPPGGSFMLPMQGAESACCLGNWVGRGFAFADAFTPEPDEGVGGGWVTFHVGAAGSTDAEIASGSPVTTGEQVAQSATNTAYRAVAVLRDELDNRRTIPLQPSDGNSLSNAGGGVLGVDKIDPDVRFSAGSLADRAINPPADATWTVRAEDAGSGFSALPARTTVRHIAPGVDGAAACPFPGTASCQPSPDALSRSVPASGDGYFVFDTRILDRGGNVSRELSRSALRDGTPPVVEEVQRPVGALIGSNILVRAPSSDDVDLHVGVLSLRFAAQSGLPQVGFPFVGPDTVGHRFDGSPVASATPTWETRLIASVERADAGPSGLAPSGILRPLSGLRVRVSDAARNETTVDASLSTTSEDGPQSFSVTARGDDEGVRRWSLQAEESSVCAPRGGLAEGGSCGSTPPTVLLQASARGQAETFPAPFEIVHFYAMVDGQARWLGSSAGGELVAEGGGPEGRNWSWAFEWSPEEDFPAGARDLFVIGVDSAANALQTVNPVTVSVVPAS